MTALLLWLLAPALPAAAIHLRAAFRNPRKLTFLDRPLPRIHPARILDRLTIPLRMRRATGEHAKPLELRRGRNGLLRNSEDPTGELPALDDSMFEVAP